MIVNPFLSMFTDAPVLINAERAHQCQNLVSAAYDLLSEKPEGRVVLSRIGVAMSEDDDGFWPAEDDWMSGYRPYCVKDGVLTIPVQGMLVAGLGYQIGGYLTGYPYIKRAFDRGMADAKVNGIALLINSPGGQVSENFDLVDHMWNAKDKPIKSIVSEDCYSAAYSIASLGPISITRHGGAGSVGVVTSHVDYSKAMEKAGIAITFISAPEGGLKTEGNPYQALSKAAQARIQERIDEIYAVFVDTVARNRKMESQAIRDTRAGVFSATQALENGLVDSIEIVDDAMAAFTASSSKNRRLSMAKEITEESLVSATTAATASGKKEGAKEGAASERARMSAIMDSDEGKARPIAARTIAFDSDMSSVDAIKFLAKLPTEAAKKKGKDDGDAEDETDGGADEDTEDKNGKKKKKKMTSSRESGFDVAMSKGNPNLHRQGDEDADEKKDTPQAKANAILADYRNAGGFIVENTKTA